MNGVELYLIMTLVFIIGFVFGYLVTKAKKVGTFTINYSDPEKDLCQLELTEDLDTIDKLRNVSLKIRVIKE